MMIESLQQQLSLASDPQVKQWFESYMKYSLPFRGLKLPRVKSIIIAWVKTENFCDRSPAEQLNTALTIIREPWGEDKLAGILLIQEVLIKNNLVDWETELPQFATLFDDSYIQDWSTCDWFCIRVLNPLIKKHGKPYATLLRSSRQISKPTSNFFTSSNSRLCKSNSTEETTLFCGSQ